MAHGLASQPNTLSFCFVFRVAIQTVFFCSTISLHDRSFRKYLSENFCDAKMHQFPGKWCDCMQDIITDHLFFSRRRDEFLPGLPRDHHQRPAGRRGALQIRRAHLLPHNLQHVLQGAEPRAETRQDVWDSSGRRQEILQVRARLRDVPLACAVINVKGSIRTQSNIFPAGGRSSVTSLD